MTGKVADMLSRIISAISKIVIEIILKTWYVHAVMYLLFHIHILKVWKAMLLF